MLLFSNPEEMSMSTIILSTLNQFSETLRSLHMQTRVKMSCCGFCLVILVRLSSNCSLDD